MSSFAVTRELEPGTLVSGKYRTGRPIGEGGFGRVYEAENVTLGIAVALKVGRVAGCDDRFRREARIAAQLRSPHSVRVYDVDWLADGTPCIVMELLKGESVRTYLRRYERVDAGQALRWMQQLCQALHEAHGFGLVHRDIKPGNLFLVENGTADLTIKLVDFGLAKSLAPTADESLTESGILIGSPAYMSPEQVRGAGVAAESDIWSLGVVLYELLSGHRPFDGASGSAILAAIVADPPTPLHEVVPDCPARIQALVERCLREVPGERFRSVRQLESELNAALAEWEGHTQEAAHDDASATLSHILPASSDFRESTKARWRRGKSWLAAAGAALVVSAGVWWQASPTAPERPGVSSAAGPVLTLESAASNSARSTLQRPSLAASDVPRRPERPAPTQPERAKPSPPEQAPPRRPKPPALSAPPPAASVPFLFEEPDF